MTPHAPKTAALEALAADLLSDEGTRRIRKHLRECEVCRNHFATIHVYRESQEFIRTSSPDAGGRPVDWSKMELALAREARSQAAQNRAASPANGSGYPWLVGGAIAVAAAALAAIGLSQGWGAPSPTRTSDPVVVAHETVPATSPVEQHRPDVQFAAGVVSLVAGEASFASDFADSASSPLDVGQRLSRGAVMTSAGAQAQLALEGPSSTGGPGAIVARLAMGASTQISLGEVSALPESEGVASETIALLAGGRATVDAFERSSRVVVLAGAYRIEVQAARCAIELTRDEGEERARVLVASIEPEGAVVVVDRAGERHTLSAGSAWGSAPTAEAEALSALTLAPIEGALLSLSYPDAVRFEIGEEAYEGGPSLALRVPVGPLTVRALDAEGHAFRAEIDVGPEGLALTPDRLEPVRARIVGFLPPEDITPVVRQSQRTLQRCYEQALRLHPDIGSGVIRARVTLDSHGAVRLVELEGESVPPSLEQCVRQEAARWSFPPPGGPMSFELPLRFQARQ
ncbi:MAG: AgmX/PglI C-terminal domain-containing protein [Sandaracinaceae bacterium]|nr:AgmX/PglI C-terminal domain-containing protein [Sandaracinaceae bacterium]